MRRHCQVRWRGTGENGQLEGNAPALPGRRWWLAGEKQTRPLEGNASSLPGPLAGGWGVWGVGCWLEAEGGRRKTDQSAIPEETAITPHCPPIPTPSPISTLVHGDQARFAAIDQIRIGPTENHPILLRIDEENQMNKQPGQPRGDSGEMRETDFRHRGVSANCRHEPLVEKKRLGCPSATERLMFPRHNFPAAWRPAIAREGIPPPAEMRLVADDKHFRMSREAQSSTITRPCRSSGTPRLVPERRRFITRRPNHRPRRDFLAACAAPPLPPRLFNPRLRRTSTPISKSCRRRFRERSGANAGDSRRSIDEEHSRLRTGRCAGNR